MTKPDFALTAAMLTAILSATKIENEPMRAALHDVLVDGVSPSAAAERHGFNRQQLHVRLKHIRVDLKPAFDAYAALVISQAGAKKGGRDA